MQMLWVGGGRRCMSLLLFPYFHPSFHLHRTETPWRGTLLYDNTYSVSGVTHNQLLAGPSGQITDHHIGLIN